MSLPELTPEQRIPPPHFELRMSLIYGTLFLAMGVHLPYFPLWLESIGFDAGAIAVILSAPLFLRIFTTPMITAYADRAPERAHVYIGLVAGALILSFGYFLSTSFAWILGVSLVFSIFWTPHSPMADSLALSGVRRFGADYAKMRIWGSLAFLFANVAGGLVLARTAPSVVIVLISAGIACALAASLLAPRLGRPRRASPLSAAELPEARVILRQPYFLYFVISAGLANSSHGFVYAFGSIYWTSLGLGEGTVGLLWAVSVVAEVIMFMVFRRRFSRFPTAGIIAFAAFVAVLRWIAFPLVWPFGLGVAGFAVVQSLHAFTTGLQILCMQRMIAETIPEERSGAAQGAAFFATAAGMAATTLLSGPLFEAYGGNGFLVMAGIAALGFVFALLAMRSAPQLGLRGK